MRHNFTCNATDRTEQVIDIPWFQIQSKFKQFNRNKANMTILRHLPITTNLSSLWSRFHNRTSPLNQLRAGLGAFLRFHNGGSHRATLHPPAPENGVNPERLKRP
eukprot:s1060_g3.t1